MPETAVQPPLLGAQDPLPNETVKLIYWPAGYFDRAVGGNFIVSSTPNTAKDYALSTAKDYTLGSLGYPSEEGVYRPHPGHIALQVKVPATAHTDAQEYYLSIGPDKAHLPQTAKDILGPLKAVPVAYGGTLDEEIAYFETQGRTAIIKAVDFVDATKVKNFIIKFNKVNDHIKFIKAARDSIEEIIQQSTPPKNLSTREALQYLEQAKINYNNARDAIAEVALAAESLNQIGFLPLNDLNKINQAAKDAHFVVNKILQLHTQMSKSVTGLRNPPITVEMQQAVRSIRENLQETEILGKEAAGKDAYYSLMAGGLWAPEGHSCVSIVSNALCYGDINGEFRQQINARNTLPSPDVFSSLVPGVIQAPGAAQQQDAIQQQHAVQAQIAAPRRSARIIAQNTGEWQLEGRTTTQKRR